MTLNGVAVPFQTSRPVSTRSGLPRLALPFLPSGSCPARITSLIWGSELSRIATKHASGAEFGRRAVLGQAVVTSNYGGAM